MDENTSNKLEGLHHKPDQMEETRWEGQYFSEVVAPEEEEEVPWSVLKQVLLGISYSGDMWICVYFLYIDIWPLRDKTSMFWFNRWRQTGITKWWDDVRFVNILYSFVSGGGKYLFPFSLTWPQKMPEYQCHALITSGNQRVPCRWPQLGLSTYLQGTHVSKRISVLLQRPCRTLLSASWVTVHVQLPEERKSSCFVKKLQKARTH